MSLEQEGPRCLEALAASRRAWRLDGARIAAYVRVEYADAEPPPEAAAIAAEWVQPLYTIPGAVVHGNRRELSEPERRELRRYIRDLTLKPVGPTLLLTAWFSLPLILGTAAQYQVQLVLCGAITVRTWYWMARNLQRASRIARDLRAGSVMILRRGPLPDELEFEYDGELSEPIEILPIARIDWTVNGRPAGWRRIGKVARVRRKRGEANVREAV